MSTSRIKKRLAVLPLLAIFALGTSVIAGPGASASPAGNGAETAKKKCKKKQKKKAGAAKKKKCKKKKKKKQPAPKPAPLVRATLTWDSVADLDLVVFDASGSRGRAASNPIASTAFSANDIDGQGPETFTDLIYVNPGRNFSYGVCFQDGGSQPTNFTLDYVTADGVHHTGTNGVDPLGSDGAHREFDGGVPIADPEGYCPAP